MAVLILVEIFPGNALLGDPGVVFPPFIRERRHKCRVCRCLCELTVSFPHKHSQEHQILQLQLPGQAALLFLLLEIPWIYRGCAENGQEKLLGHGRAVREFPFGFLEGLLSKISFLGSRNSVEKCSKRCREQLGMCQDQGARGKAQEIRWDQGQTENSWGKLQREQILTFNGN